MQVYVSDAERAKRLVDDAIRAGKVLPALHEEAEIRASEDPLRFEAEIARAPALVDFRELGSDEDAPSDPIELGPIPDTERAAALSRVAQELYETAGQLTAADYPMAGKPWLIANQDRWQLRAVADWAWDRASSMRRRLAQRLDPIGAARPRGRPEGTSNVRLEEFAAGERAIVPEVNALAEGHGRAVLAAPSLNTEQRRQVIERVRRGKAIRQEDRAAWLGLPLGTYKTYASKLKKLRQPE